MKNISTVIFGYMGINNLINLSKPLQYILILFMLAAFIEAAGQDLSQLAKSKAVTVKGGVSTSSSMYNAWGTTSRRDPYFWQLNANLNFNILGIIDMPFSASFSKENHQYQQPSFKQYGASPHYKSVTLHLGYRSMSLSQYSLSGLTFFGVGAEYKPNNFWLNASAMYGRFAKAVSPSDSIKQAYEPIAYKRMGTGLKLSFLPKGQCFDLIFFKGWDDPNSIHDTASLAGLTPADNFIIGFASRNKLSDKISVQTEYSMSAYTSDINTPVKSFDKYTYLNNLGDVYKPRYSSSMEQAYSLALAYQGTVMGYSISYKRIDPNYRSLGSTYIENDLEDVLFSVSGVFFNNKVNTSGSIGQQRNNITNDQLTVNKRIIGSASLNYLISPSVNCNINYSNYTTNSQPTSINFTDSIRYYQINKNTSGMINYNAGSSKIKHGVTVMIAFQEASTLNETATERLRTGTEMINGNVSYQFNMVKEASSVTVAYQHTNYKTGTGVNNSYGPSVSVQKGVFKNKLRLTGSYGYQASSQSGTKGGASNIFRLNAGIQMYKSHSLRLSSSYSIRKQTTTAGVESNMKELNSALQYQFSF